MEKEFNLSEKIYPATKKRRNFDFIRTKDIKEAVRLLKEELEDIKHGIHPSSQIVVKRIIDKIFGDKLT